LHTFHLLVFPALHESPELGIFEASGLAFRLLLPWHGKEKGYGLEAKKNMERTAYTAAPALRGMVQRPTGHSKCDKVGGIGDGTHGHASGDTHHAIHHRQR
jgi:hypothetical protein